MATYNYGAGHTVNGDAGSAFVDSYKKSKLAQLLGQAYQAPEAQRGGLLAQMMQVDPESGMQAARMLDPRFSRAAQGGNAQQEYAEWLLKQAPADQRDQVLGVLAGYKARPSGAAIQYKPVVGADGITRMTAYDPNEVGAQVIGSGETYGSGVGGGQPYPPQGVPGLYQTQNGPMRLLSPLSPEELEAAQADMAGGGGQEVRLPDRNVSPQQRQWTQNTPNPYGNAMPNPFQSRPQEQQKYLDEQAGQQAKIDALPRVGQIEAQNAGLKETATQGAQIAAEAPKIAAKSRGEAVATWPKVRQSSLSIVSTIDGILNHPGLDKAAGINAANPINRVYGTDGYDFVAKMKQLQGKAFTQAFESLKGGGAITEKEGEAATAAIANLDRAQSPAQFRKALRDLQNTAINAMQTHAQKMRAAPQRSAATGGFRILD